MREYTYPAEINIPVQRAQAARRRTALLAHGCATYILGWRDGLPRILCLCCGLGTQNSRDIKEKYCGFCRSFHAEWSEEAARNFASISAASPASQADSGRDEVEGATSN